MLRLNKKGFEFLTNWVVVFFIALLILSFLLSLIIVNSWINYLIILFVGVFLGHFMFTSTEGNRFPYYMLSFAFISGYILGNFVSQVSSGLVMLVLFIGAMVATHRILKATQ